MRAFCSMGEARLLAYEGERMVAFAIAGGVRRLVQVGLAWIGRPRSSTAGRG